MNDLSLWSNLAITTAAVLYVAALMLHAAEWSSARGLHQVVAPVRRRRRTLVTAGVAGDSTSTEGVAAEGPAGDDEARPESDQRDPERRIDFFGRLGVSVTVIAVVANVLGMVLRGVAANRAPWGNMYEFMISATAFVGAAYVVLAICFRMRWLGLPVTLLLALGNGAAVTLLYVDVAPLVPALRSVWFVVHIVSAALSGTAFTVGGVASVFYLIRQRLERQEEVKGYLTKLPHSSMLDVISYRMVAFAFPLWTFAVAAGAVWAEYAWGRFWGWDPKETWALVTWMIYACYLHARSTAGWKGNPAAWISILGMVSFWFNFIGVNLLFTGLHSYSGL
ncbi:MAG: c-type cytochrome biogenesis protein CcsB [Propionibacteriales bacterium]|nr:c-type cytochrome biogenesis protein CcsB [Propionibacteriales bacterium]